MSFIIHSLGLQDYQETWQKMRVFTNQRLPDTADELWLLQHPSVFTQGQAGKAEYIFNSGDIPVVQTDRGGQVTYHGPGQLVVYPLFNLVRRKIGVKIFVHLLEQVIINLLANYNIGANLRDDAPGVYVEEKKICSIGLKIRRGCSYHGIALNVAMDLTPFSRINPCGLGIKMTQIKDFFPYINMQEVEQKIIGHFADLFRCD